MGARTQETSTWLSLASLPGPHGFTGTVRTLTLNVKANIRTSTKDNDKSPDYRFYANTVEFGAAWQKTSAADRSYLSCKLDDPSFPAPIYASLVAAG